MATYADYFSDVTYKPQYYLGDRVRGFYGEGQKIPFSGTVAVDHQPYVGKLPSVKVFLDLPLMVDGKMLTMVSVEHDSVQMLK
jgi:hypothetical protein